MAARTPRRSFVNPFVITLAAIPACTESPPPQPPHTNPPPPTQPTDPVTQQPTPTPAPTDPATPTPAPVDPAQTKPASPGRHWLITRNGATCMAMERADCPKPEPGKPTRTCNPPPPFKYTCPDGLADKASLTVAQWPGATECVIPAEPVKCPPNVACNPPPPRVVPCPTR